MEEATVGMEGMSVRGPTVTPVVLRALLERMETNDIKELPMEEAVKYLVETEATLRREAREDDVLATKVEGIDLNNHTLHDNSGSETEDSILGMKANDNISNGDIDFDIIQPGDRLDENVSVKSRSRFGPFGHPAYEKPENDDVDDDGDNGDDDDDDDDDSIKEPESLRPRHGGTPHAMKLSGEEREAEPVFGPELDGIPDINEPGSDKWSVPQPATAPEQPHAFTFGAQPPPPPPRTAESFDGGAFWGAGGGTSKLASSLNTSKGAKGGNRKPMEPSTAPNSNSETLDSDIFGDNHTPTDAEFSFGLPSQGDSPSSTGSTMEVADGGESSFTFKSMGDTGSSSDATDTLPVPPSCEPAEAPDDTQRDLDADRYAAASFSFGQAQEVPTSSTPPPFAPLSATSPNHPSAPTKDGAARFNVGSRGKGPGGKSKQKRANKSGGAGAHRTATGSENIDPTGGLETVGGEDALSNGELFGEASRGESGGHLFSKQAATPASELEKTLTLHERAGKEAYKANKYEESFQSFSKVLLMAPPKWSGRPRVLGNRAAAHMMAQKFILAANDCESALAIDASLVKLHVRRARCMLRMGMFTKTEEICSRVLILDDDVNGPKAKGDHDVEAAKRDARKCLEDLSAARELTNRLQGAEAVLDYEVVIATCNLLSDLCPMFRVSHTAKVRALNKLAKWKEAKTFAESVTCGKDPKELEASAHPNAHFPPPSSFSLAWIVKNGTLNVDISSVSNVMLCMEPSLAQAYLSAIKNVEACHTHANDVMKAVNKVIRFTMQKSKSAPMESNLAGASWRWLEIEATTMEKILELKGLGDQLFKEHNFAGARQHYTNALCCNPAAARWAAILHSNRAAAYMGSEMYQEAVKDCHQAISKDCEYPKAYLRRARAFRAIKDYSSSVRDYRKYLVMIGESIDNDRERTEVGKELQTVLQSQKMKTEADKRRQQADEDAARYGHYNNHGRHQSGPSPRSKHRSQRAKPSSSGWAGLGGSKFYDSDEDMAFDDDPYFSYSEWDRATSGFPGNRYNSRGAGAGGGKPGANFYNQQRKQYQGHAGGARGHPNTGGRGYQHRQQQQKRFDLESDSDEGEDHYHTLGVRSNATEAEVKKAYRAMALKYHPDKNKEEGAVDRFKEVGEAYAVLSDKTQRRQYDLSRKYG